MEQIPLLFPTTFNISLLDLIKGANNEEVISFLFNKFLVSEENIVLIYGNNKVGKSYISHLFIKEVKGEIISFSKISNLVEAVDLVNTNKVFLLEHIDNITLDEEKLLFYFYNLISNSKSHLILTSTTLPKNINFHLPDLSSRILSIRSLEIKEPQEDTIKILLFKMFQDKQIKVNMAIINYILMRVERKSKVLYKLIEEIEKKLFVTKKKLTLTLVKKVIEQLYL